MSEEKEETLALAFYEGRQPGFAPFQVNNETDLPISLEMELVGYTAPGFVQRLSKVWIAPSAITRVIVTVRLGKMSFWQKLKWLLGRGRR